MSDTINKTDLSAQNQTKNLQIIDSNILEAWRALYGNTNKNSNETLKTAKAHYIGEFKDAESLAKHVAEQKGWLDGCHPMLYRSIDFDSLAYAIKCDDEEGVENFEWHYFYRYKGFSE